MAFFVKKEKSCCSCFGLKTGTLIILGFFLITSVYQMSEYVDFILTYHELISEIGLRASTLIDAYVYWVVWSMFAIALLFYIIPCTLAVYGVYMRKASYLQPFILSLAVEVVNLIMLLVVLLVLFVILCAYRPGLESNLSEIIKHSTQFGYKANPEFMKANPGILPFPENASATILNAVIFCCFFIFAVIGVSTFISYYFTCVVHSYYLKMKEEDHKEHTFYSPAPGKKQLPA